MNSRMLELALRKQRLLTQSASQRRQFAAQAQGLQPLFSGADKVAAGVQWLRQHPALVAVTSAAFFVLRPRFLVRLAMRGFSTWQMLQAFRGRRRR